MPPPKIIYIAWFLNYKENCFLCIFNLFKLEASYCYFLGYGCNGAVGFSCFSLKMKPCFLFTPLLFQFVVLFLQYTLPKFS